MEIFLVSDGKGFYWDKEDGTMTARFDGATIFRNERAAKAAAVESRMLGTFIMKFYASFVRTERYDISDAQGEN